jgi:DNA ligase-1
MKPGLAKSTLPFSKCHPSNFPNCTIMIEFARLVNTLGTSTKTNDKLDALAAYFLSATDKDKVWVIALFSGRRPRRIASGSQLAQWC